MITHSNSKENIHRRGSTSVHLDAVIQFLPKKLHHVFFIFFLEFGKFFQNRHKEQLLPWNYNTNYKNYANYGLYYSSILSLNRS